MRTFTFYDVTSGQFSGSVFSLDEMTDANLKRNTPDGHSAVEGRFDHLSQKVDVSQLAELRATHESAHAARVQALRDSFHPSMPGSVFHEPAMPLFIPPATVVIDYKPPAPNADHEWNPAIKRWVLNEAVAARNSKRAAARTRIIELEISQLRPLRELARDSSNAAEARKRLDAIDGEITQLRQAL